MKEIQKGATPCIHPCDVITGAAPLPFINSIKREKFIQIKNQSI